jgi:hypothetical protein
MKTFWGLVLVGGLVGALFFGGLVAQINMTKAPGLVAMYGVLGFVSVLAFFLGAVKFSRGE